MIEDSFRRTKYHLFLIQRRHILSQTYLQRKEIKGTIRDFFMLSRTKQVESQNREEKNN